MDTATATGPTVLVVEDNVIDRAGLAVILARHGYTALAAADGQEAWACLRHGLRPDVILLALQAPPFAGLGFLRELARDPESGVVVFCTHDPVEFVALSAWSERQRVANENTGAAGRAA